MSKSRCAYPLYFFSLLMICSGGLFSQAFDTTLAKKYHEIGKDQAIAANYDSALSYFQRAYSIYKAADKTPEYLAIQLDQAKILENQGKAEQAFQLAKETLQACEKLLPEGTYPISHVHSELGLMYFRRGEKGSANFHAESAVELERKKGIPSANLVSFIVNQANLQVSFGHFQEGITAYEEALQMFEDLKLNDESLLSRIYGNLGNVYQKIGDNKRAENMQLKGLDIKYKRLPADHPSIAISLLNLSNSQKGIGNLEQAIETLEKSRKIFAKNPKANQRNLAFVLANQAMNYVAIKEYEEAKNLAKQAVNIIENLYQPGHPLITQMYLRLGLVFGTTDKEEEFKWYQHGLSLINEDMAPVIKIRALENIGTNLYERGLYVEALSYMDKAEALILSNPSDPQNKKSYHEIDDKELLFWILWGKAYAYRRLAKEGKEKESNLLSAKTYYESAISLVNIIYGQLRYEESQKALLSDYLREVYEEAIWVCIELNKINPDPDLLTQAFEWAETRKSTYLLASMRTAETQRFSGISASILELEKKLKGELGELDSKLAGAEAADSVQQKEILAQQQELRSRFDSLVRVIEQEYPNYFQIKYQQAPISLEEVQKKLAPGTLLLEYYEGAENYFLFAIRSDNFDVYSLEKSARTDSLLSEFLNVLSDKKQVESKGASKESIDRYVEQARALYNLFLPEVLDMQKITSVIIVPDGKLSYLPFDLLLEESAGEMSAENWRELPYLFQRYNIQYAYSASVRYSEAQKRKTAGQVFAGFAPKYSSDFFAKSRDLEFMYKQRTVGSLKFNREEVTEIATYYWGKTYLETNASEQVFKAEAADYQVLHLAMHAFVNDEEAMYSGLLFSPTQEGDTTEDGFLHAYEIYELDLNADLVILSACNTGQGAYQEGEGVVSLARAFAYAGCPNIMMSLWQADDAASRVLMQAYHKNLSEGSGKVEALQLARNSYLESSDLTHPYYWGSFVLMGDDLPLKGSFNFWLWGLLLVGLLGAVFLVGEAAKAQAIVMRTFFPKPSSIILKNVDN